MSILRTLDSALTKRGSLERPDGGETECLSRARVILTAIYNQPQYLTEPARDF